jgi:hypothetical protein
MPLKLYKRKILNGFVWHYRGKVGEDYLRGTTGTANKADAARFIAALDRQHFQRGLTGPQDLTFPEAVVLYEKAGKGQDKRSQMYIIRLLRHWGDKPVRDMTAGAIRQSTFIISSSVAVSGLSMDLLPDFFAMRPIVTKTLVIAQPRQRGIGLRSSRPWLPYGSPTSRPRC